MYGYYNYATLSQEEILSKVSQEDIFKIVITEDIVLNKGAFYKAPYRDDNIATCYFEEYNGILFFMDYADTEGKHTKDCINIIQRYFNLNYQEALKFIGNYFNLSSNSVNTYLPPKLSTETTTQKRKISISIAPREFNTKDRLFWSKYQISRANLEEDKVIPISMFKSINRNNESFVIKPFDVMYAYTDFPEGKIKIYRPESPLKEGKWFTNCNQNDIGCIDSLPESGDILIITKSYKDCRVLRNQGLTSIWFQSEAIMPSDSILLDLCNRFKNIVIWFDNDQTGLAKAKLLKDHINGMSPNKSITVFLPPKLYKEENIKDPSDYIAAKGRDALRRFLIQKQLLHES